MAEDIRRLDATPIEAKPTYYTIASPPRPHPDFASVIVQAVPGIGVCWIKGLGNEFETDDFGIQARNHAMAIKDQLETKYGKAELIDILVPGSLWNEPRDWLMGLRKGDRDYGFHWKQPSNPPKQWLGISQIYVGLQTTSTGVRANVEYYSPRSADCDAAAKKAAAGAL
jgi:hypothetical protein